MKKSEISELHYITPIVNVASILQHGILSHRKIQGINHACIDMKEVQKKRTFKTVPGGRALHEYVNLYLTARNPMLYKRLNFQHKICILRVDASILNISGVIITTGNAASDYTAFHPITEDMPQLKKEVIFAESWKYTTDDEIEMYRKKSAKCAEVLVPDCVESTFVQGAYVSCKEAKDMLKETAPLLNVSLNKKIFFQDD